jgi:hypothetical protein
MVSEKRLEANRRNAHLSTGPKTPEGKARSSRNNLRHGLTGQITVLPGEDREVHDAFCNELIDCLKPGNPMERDLAQSIAEDSWRLNRIVAIETNMFALGHRDQRSEIQIALADARTFQERAAQFNLLSTYEQRINRNRQRNLKVLQELQAGREAEQEKAMEQAKLLAQESLAQGIAYEPARDGFEFSNVEINKAIDRDNRLRAAKIAELKPAERPARRREAAVDPSNEQPLATAA